MINQLALKRLNELKNGWNTTDQAYCEKQFISAYHCASPDDNARKLGELLLKRFNSNRVHFADQKARALFKALPKTVTLYRGAKKGARFGISWTTNLEVARWFACESVNKNEGYVLKLVIDKRRITAVVGGYESECLVKVSRARRACRVLETTQQIRKIRTSHYKLKDWLTAYDN